MAIAAQNEETPAAKLAFDKLEITSGNL